MSRDNLKCDGCKEKLKPSFYVAEKDKKVYYYCDTCYEEVKHDLAIRKKKRSKSNT